MKIKFWGVRGSIPSPYGPDDLITKIESAFWAAKDRQLKGASEIRDYVASLPPRLNMPVGGNTPCVEVSHGDQIIILDAGSGLRRLGISLMQNLDAYSSGVVVGNRNVAMALDLDDLAPEEVKGEALEINFLISHTHWDHILGLPFFGPAYMPGASLNFYGVSEARLQEAFALQMSAPHMFPISLNGLAAAIKFHTFPAGGLELGEVKVETMHMPHPGGSRAYKLTAGGKSMIYATDYEFTDVNRAHLDEFVKFISGADVFISDTQYTYLESVAREGWGHSTSFSAVDLAVKADIKSFYLFHHDPDHSDEKLYDNLDKTQAYYEVIRSDNPMSINLAIEGAAIEL